VGLCNENGECSKRPSSKAAGLLARGAYTEYVSTPKARERSWRPFSTLPRKGSEDLAKSSASAVDSDNLGQAPNKDHAQVQAHSCARGLNRFMASVAPFTTKHLSASTD